MEYYRWKFLAWGCRATSREDAIRRGIELIKKDPSAFVVGADIPEPKRSVLGRLFLG